MVVVTGENDVIVCDEGAGDLQVTIPAGTYFWRNDDSAADMVKVLKTALDAGLTHTYTVGMGSVFVAGTKVGILSFGTASSSFDVQWNDALTTVPAYWFGFDVATYSSTLVAGVGHVVASPWYVGRTWFPEQEWVDQKYTQPTYHGSQQEMSDGSFDTQFFGRRYDRDILLDLLPLNKCFQEFESSIQEAFIGQDITTHRPSDFIAAGERFEFCPDYQDKTGALTNAAVRSAYKPRGEKFVSNQEMVIPSGLVNLHNLWLLMSEWVE